MIENVRQICIYNYAYLSLNKPKIPYWDYMNFFYTDCMKANPPKFNENCAKESMIKAKIDHIEIGQCIVKSFNSCNFINKYSSG